MQRVFTLLLSLPIIGFAASGHFPLQHMQVDVYDKSSLQRGAKWYMNYCSGCHSLKYARYQRIGKDIGIVHYDGTLDSELLKDNLIMTDAKIGDTVTIAMPLADAKQWFGVAPPDLTLEARVRGTDWIYTYLSSFYQDHSRPWGVNNALFPQVSMPNVLQHLQGTYVAVTKQKHINADGISKTVDAIDHLQLTAEGQMSQLEADRMVKDIVNFLAYVAEPVYTQRRSQGVMVLLFLCLFVAATYALKKEFWKDIH